MTTSMVLRFIMTNFIKKRQMINKTVFREKIVIIQIKIDITLNIVGNDKVMMLSWCNILVLSWNSPKSVTFDNIYDFVVSESFDGGVLYTQDTWLLIFLFIYIYFAIFVIQSITNITFYQFLQIKSSFQIFWNRARKCNSFNWFPCEKCQKIFWYKRFATQIQKSCIVNISGWIPPCFPLIVGNFLFFHFFIVSFFDQSWAYKVNLG